jgi:hypothetical protein
MSACRHDEAQRKRAGPTIMCANFRSTERTVKKLLFRIWRQQEDFPNAAFLP